MQLNNLNTQKKGAFSLSRVPPTHQHMEFCLAEMMSYFAARRTRQSDNASSFLECFQWHATKANDMQQWPITIYLLWKNMVKPLSVSQFTSTQRGKRDWITFSGQLITMFIEQFITDETNRRQCCSMESISRWTIYNSSKRLIFIEWHTITSICKRRTLIEVAMPRRCDGFSCFNWGNTLSHITATAAKTNRREEKRFILF